MKSKLVRDKVPLLIPGEYRECADFESLKYLSMKLVEESLEFLVSRDLMELADVYEVLLEIARRLGVNLEELRSAKRLSRGGFEKLWCVDD